MNIFPSSEAHQAVLQLPFVDTDEANPDHLEFWNVEATGNYDADIAMGEHAAGMVLAIARQFAMPLIIAMVLRDIALAGTIGPVEAGFIASISSAARVGAHH
jgi:hypothetical protein